MTLRDASSDEKTSITLPSKTWSLAVRKLFPQQIPPVMMQEIIKKEEGRRLASPAFK